MWNFISRASLIDAKTNTYVYWLRVSELPEQYMNDNFGPDAMAWCENNANMIMWLVDSPNMDYLCVTYCEARCVFNEIT